jgi:hypothetical protein
MHTTSLLYQNRHERNNLGGVGVDGRIILNWILKKLGVTMWTGFIQLRRVSSGCSHEHASELSGSTKCGNFLIR